mmetsp:Transcript_38289/g.89973  ORF Transcript_38289/g.89973 Transcript_38289/m.89973 type:complete len:385 (-) Transcript_38289:1265-2419(-)
MGRPSHKRGIVLMVAPKAGEGDEVLQAAGNTMRSLSIYKPTKEDLKLIAGADAHIGSKDHAKASADVAAVDTEVGQRNLCLPIRLPLCLIRPYAEDVHPAFQRRRHAHGIRTDRPWHHVRLGQHLDGHVAGWWEGHHQWLLKLRFLHERLEPLVRRLCLNKLPFPTKRMLRAGLGIELVLGASCEGDGILELFHEGTAEDVPAFHVIQVDSLIQRHQLFLQPLRSDSPSIRLDLHHLLPAFSLAPLPQQLQLFVDFRLHLLADEPIIVPGVGLQEVILGVLLVDMDFLWRLPQELRCRHQDQEVAATPEQSDAEDPWVQDGSTQRHHAFHVAPAAGLPQAAAGGGEPVLGDEIEARAWCRWASRRWRKCGWRTVWNRLHPNTRQ